MVQAVRIRQGVQRSLFKHAGSFAFRRGGIAVNASEFGCDDPGSNPECGRSKGWLLRSSSSSCSMLDARCSQLAARSPQLPAGEPRSFCPPRWSAVCSRHIYSPLQPSPVAPARATKCWPGFCAKAHPGNSTAQQSRGAESTRCPGTRRRDGRSPAARSAAGGRPARRVAEPPRPSARQAAIPSNKVSLSLSLSLFHKREITEGEARSQLA